MVLLSEAIGTKYIINKINKRLRLKLDSLIGQEVDLAGCRFGPECASILEKYYDKIVFRNTEDSALDTMLQENRRLILNPEEEWPELDFGAVVKKETWFEDIPKIPQGKYLIKIDTNDIVQECLLILMIMARPDIEYDLSNCMADIMEIVARRVNIEDFDEDKVYVTKTPYVVLVNKDDVDRYAINPVPACFGRDKMIGLDGTSPILPHGFKYLITWIDDVVTKNMATKEEEKVDITQFLQMRD